MIKYIHKKASIFIFQFIYYMLYTIIYTAIIILYNLYTTIKEIHNTIGEPWPQIIANWVSTTGTSSIKGELQETNLSGLKSK